MLLPPARFHYILRINIIINMQRSLHNAGYTLLEMIIYISILAVITVTLVNMLLTFVTSYRSVGVLRIAEHTGTDAMERIVRDTRSATSIDAPNSTLGTSPGVLTLVSTSNGVSTTTKYYVQSGTLKVDVNGAYFGPLSSTNTSITNLVFTQAASATTTLLKIDMTVQGSLGGTVKTKTYHTSVVLGG